MQIPRQGACKALPECDPEIPEAFARKWAERFLCSTCTASAGDAWQGRESLNVNVFDNNQWQSQKAVVHQRLEQKMETHTAIIPHIPSQVRKPDKPFVRFGRCWDTCKWGANTLQVRKPCASALATIWTAKKLLRISNLSIQHWDLERLTTTRMDQGGV